MRLIIGLSFGIFIYDLHGVYKALYVCLWSVSHTLSHFKLHHIERKTHPVQHLTVLSDERRIQNRG